MMRERAEMTAAILANFDAAATNQDARGRGWYPLAASLAAGMVAGTHLEPAQGIGTIAAISPRKRWPNNLRDAGRMIAAAAQDAPIPILTTRTNCTKAARILAGYDPLDVLGGPKVRAFYAAMCGDADAVAVDVWASRAAQVPAPSTLRRYATIADAYRAAADARGIAPRDLQAITWIVAREHAQFPNQLCLEMTV